MNRRIKNKPTRYNLNNKMSKLQPHTSTTGQNRTALAIYNPLLTLIKTRGVRQVESELPSSEGTKILDNEIEAGNQDQGDEGGEKNTEAQGNGHGN